MTRLGRLVGQIASAPIVAYQRFISPALGPRCRYAPSCSTYALQAIRVHGPIKGFVLGAWRLLRCNPWSLGGVDHVPEPGPHRPLRRLNDGLGPLRNNETAAPTRHGESE